MLILDAAVISTLTLLGYIGASWPFGGALVWMESIFFKKIVNQNLKICVLGAIQDNPALLVHMASVRIMLKKLIVRCTERSLDMKLKQEKTPVKKVRVMVLELLGTKVVKAKSISLYETNHQEVFAVVEEALNEAADKNTCHCGGSGIAHPEHEVRSLDLVR